MTAFTRIETTRSPIKRKALVEEAYLDYFNNYLTVRAFAIDYGCAEGEAMSIIEEGRHWNNLPKIEAIEA